MPIRGVSTHAGCATLSRMRDGFHYKEVEFPLAGPGRKLRLGSAISGTLSRGNSLNQPGGANILGIFRRALSRFAPSCLLKMTNCAVLCAVSLAASAFAQTEADVLKVSGDGGYSETVHT